MGESLQEEEELLDRLLILGSRVSISVGKFAEDENFMCCHPEMVNTFSEIHLPVFLSQICGRYEDF